MDQVVLAADDPTEPRRDMADQMYRVVWEVDIAAGDAQNAATRRMEDHDRRRRNPAPCDVYTGDAAPVRIDLAAVDAEDCNECRARVPVTCDIVNPMHETPCSLHPDA